MSKRPKLPYLGLRPFEEQDERLFFGREVQVNAALHQLEDHSFLAVVGSSGSGKSSFVRAGLLPAVRQGFLLGTTNWLIVVMRPGHQPYQRLARGLAKAIRSPGAPSVEPVEIDTEIPEDAHIIAALRRSDRGLFLALDEEDVSPGIRVLVVVDQFEELFAFRRSNAKTDRAATRDEAAAFSRMLLRSCLEPQTRIRVVVTMRSDFIGDSEAFLGLPEAISRSQFLVPRLDRTQMKDVITRPGEVKDAGFRSFTVDAELVNRIINDAGDRSDQLPLMQHALMRTWKVAVERAGSGADTNRLTLDDFTEAGGLANALSLHADAAWDRVKDDPRQANLARRLFLLLCDVTPDGQITRRRPRVDEVQAVADASVDEIARVMRVFQEDERNFLLPSAYAPLTTDVSLDISHESLIRHWKRFNDWLTDEMASVATLQRLRERAVRWPKQEPLLQEPALTVALQWDQEQHPTPAWAERYGGGLDRVLDYLEKSREARRIEEEEAVAAQREKLGEAQRRAAEQAENAKRFRRATVALAFLSLAAIAAAIYAFGQRNTNQSLSHNLQDARASLEAIQTERTTLQTRVDALKSSSRSLEATRTELDGQIRSLRKTRDALASGQRELQASNAALAAIGAAHGIVTPLESGAVAVAFQESDLSPDNSLPLLRRVGWVKSLNLSGTKVTESGLREISQLSELMSLNLSFTDVTDAGVAQLAKMSNLQQLALNDSMITEASLPLLANLVNLKSLDISRTRVNEDAVDQLRHKLSGASITYYPDPLLDALSKLRGDWRGALNKASGYTSEGRVTFVQSSITDAALKALGSYQHIQLTYCDNITNEGLKNLWRNKTLTELVLDNTSQITDQGIVNIAGISSLKELRIEDLAMTDRGLTAIAKLSGLTSLGIRSTSSKITDKGVAQLKVLASLEDLELAYTDLTDATPRTLSAMHSLKRISLMSNEEMSGQGFAALSELPLLRALDISYIDSLSDKDVEYLKRLNRLETLSVVSTGISASGIDMLRKALPNTRIAWSHTDRASFMAVRRDVSDAEVAFLRDLPTENRALAIGRSATGRLTDTVMTFRGRPAQAWGLTGCEGRKVQIDLRSDDFDALLFVVGPNLPKPLMDDDSGGGTDARLELTCTNSIKVIVSSLDDTGQFTLQATILDK